MKDQFRGCDSAVFNNSINRNENIHASYLSHSEGREIEITFELNYPEVCSPCGLRKMIIHQIKI